MLIELARIHDRKTGRASSWDTTGRNKDAWTIPAGETAVLADIRGPACITHLWMTQRNHYRECLLKITFDNADQPSVLCPLGDFSASGTGWSIPFSPCCLRLRPVFPTSSTRAPR